MVEQERHGIAGFQKPESKLSLCSAVIQSEGVKTSQGDQFAQD